MKIYSKPLTNYEIGLLHYSSNNSDKEYFVDALILKALDKDAENLFISKDKEMLLSKEKAELERMYLEMFENELGGLRIVSSE